MSPVEQSSGGADEGRAARIAQVLAEAAAQRQSGTELSDEQVCATHPDLMPELAENLKHLQFVQRVRGQAQPGLPTETRPLPSTATVQAGAVVEDSFPGYQVLREIHRGGQGVVYQALQKSTNRKVALKAMKEGPFATASEQARFEREVQILGQLNHPNIVAIHDSGQAAGCHYFVMDYISGQPLDVWMAGGSHSIEDTLKLFAKICAAVNAAHLRGITHRDLKPGNIRVDENGEPHILDFGLAKVAHGIEAASLMTLTGQFVGSLPWASPEQAEGVPGKIDLRTDVYSLGVILYQMLTGKFPYEVIGNMRDVLDRIMKAEPERPSTLGWHGRPGRGINDEVETIVLKCLAKERERRYQSAGELTRDIGHYLSGEPIEAKRDSAAYVLRKYLHKYRLATAIATGFVLVITVGMIASLTFWRQAVVERAHAEQSRIVAEERRVAAEVSEAKAVAEADEAKKQRDKAERIANFMAQALSGVGPSVALGRDTTMLQEMMDAAAKRIEDGELQAAPEAELRLRLTIGDTYRELAAYDSAERMLRPALDLARTLHSADHRDAADAIGKLASLLQDRGDLPAAEPLFREALKMCRRLFPAGHQDLAAALNNLGLLLVQRGDLAAAEPLLREAVEMHRRFVLDDNPDRATMLDNLANLLQQRGDLAEAESMFREELDMLRRLFRGDHPKVQTALNNLAYVVNARGDLVAAEPLFREALAMARRLFPGDHPCVAIDLNNLAILLRNRGDQAAAEPLARESLEMFRRLFPGDHTDVAGGLGGLAGLLQDRGDFAAAEPLFRESLDMYRRLFPAGHPRLAIALNNLAFLLAQRGDLAGAEPLYREGLEMFRKELPAGHMHIGAMAGRLGHCLAGLERFAEAEPMLLEADQILRTAQGVSPAGLARNIKELVDLYDAWNAAEPDQGYDQQAAEWRAKLAEWQASTQPATRPDGQPASAPASTPTTVPADAAAPPQSAPSPGPSHPPTP